MYLLITFYLAHGICLGRKLTSYPAVKDKLVDKYQYTEVQGLVDDAYVVPFNCMCRVLREV